MLKLPPAVALGLASLSAATAAQKPRRRAGSVKHVEHLESRVLLSGSFPGAADNALAYDAQGNQHVAYYDASAGNLKYVVQSPQGVWSAPVTIDASSTDVGRQVALAIGPSGQVGVAYYDAAGGHLKFATLVNDAWQTTVIDPKGGPGEFPSLVYNVKGCAVITYYRPQKHDLRCAMEITTKAPQSKTRNSSLRIAPGLTAQNGLTWRVNTIAQGAGPYTSLTINPATGGASAAYQLANGKLLFRNGLRSGGMGLPVCVDRTKQTPGDVSLAFGAGNLPVITYYNASTGAIQVAGVNLRGRVISASKVTVTPNADPHATVLYDSTNSKLDLVYFNAAAGAIDIAQAGGAGGPFAASQLQAGGSAATHAVLVPGTGSVAYTITAVNSGQRTLVVNTSLNTVITDPAALPAASAAPSNFAASAISSGTVKLTWTDNSDNELGFEIDRSTDGTNFAALEAIAPNVVTWSDTGLTASTTYYYRDSAIAPGGTPVAGSPASASATTMGPTAPAAPTNVAASAISSATIQLSWTDDSDNETGFEIDRSTDGTHFTQLTVTSPNVTTFSDTGLTPTTAYYYRVSALGAPNFNIPGSPTPVSATTLSINADNPQYLLTPQMLTQMRTEAANNTPQWQAFKAKLDAGLNQVTEGGYEGSQLSALGNYALGYQVLKDSDPATAPAYADKAIAIMEMGLADDVRGNTASRMLLARGDGSTLTFTLPVSSINSGTLEVWTAPVTVATITKGATNGQDTVAVETELLKVSNTSDGNPDYSQSVDWLVNPNYMDNTIDWSLASGNQPATGSTYYITESSSLNGTLLASSKYSLAGNVLTFQTAPSANQAIFVEYQYTDAAAGLRYQQTGDGHGGLNNVMIDSSYTSRNLKYIPIALDWLWSYQGLSPQLRSEATTMVVRWSDYLRDHGYRANSPASNYGAGHYAFRMATAITLQNRDPVDAARLMSEMQAYHTNNVLPMFQGPSNGAGTEQGGFWAEGWNYGALAIQNILTSELAYETAGWGSASAAKSWANDVITSLLEEQPTQSTIYDGGDGYAYPLPFPSKTMLTDVAYAATDPTLKSYANWAIQNYAGSISPGWEDMFFRDPSASAASWTSSLPLQYLSAGTGLAVARKDWNYNSTWLSFHSGNLESADHQDTGQGALELDRGSDPLLINVAAVTGDQRFQDKSTYGNAVLIDDGGAGQQTYRYAQGVWYGNPGVTMPHFEGTADFAYMQGNYAAAYTKNYGAPGSPDPASELVRDVFYARGADYVITYDRATTTQASFLKRLQWNFTGTVSVSGNAWNVASGSSKLFGQTYSDAALSTVNQTLTLSGKTIHEVQTTNSSPLSTVDYVTVMQVTSSGVAAMDTSTHVESGDGKLEGVQIGPSTGPGYVVLFGKSGTVSGGTSYQVTADSGQTLTHYLSDMTPGATYTLTGVTQATAVADAQGVLTFTTTGTGAPQTITLAPA